VRETRRSSRRDDHSGDDHYREDHYRDGKHFIPADDLGSGDHEHYIPADDIDRSEHADNYGGDSIIDDKDAKPAKPEPIVEKKEEAKSADFQFRQRRIYWLDNLSTQVFKGTNKPFLDRSEKFAVIMYSEEDPKMHDQKV